MHRGIYSISWQLQTAASTLFKDKRHPPVTFVLHPSVVKNTLCPPHLRAHTKSYIFSFRSCTTLRLCFLTEFFLHYYGSLHLSNKEITLKLIIALAKVILNHTEFLPNVFCFLLFNEHKTFLLDWQVTVTENKDLTSLHMQLFPISAYCT